MKTLKQWLKFALVGTFGVGVNAIFFTIFSFFEVFQIAPLSFLGFNELTIAWGLGILFAMTSNFLLSKLWVFKI